MTVKFDRMLFGEPFGGVIPGARGAVLATLLRTDAALTGRQIHGLLNDRYGLWTVQQAIKALAELGLITTQTVGRAGIHAVNEHHYAVAPLRVMLDPIEALTETVRDMVGDDAQTVLIFGSVARGAAQADSDLDLAVIAPAVWDRRAQLEDAVRARLGNDCDVLHLTVEEFLRPANAREPVVDDILRDGVPLIGSIPGNRPGAA